VAGAMAACRMPVQPRAYSGSDEVALAGLGVTSPPEVVGTELVVGGTVSGEHVGGVHPLV
jgi:hypothetical protein